MIQIKCVGHDTAYELGNIVHLFEPYVTTEWLLESNWDGQIAEAKLYENESLIGQKQLEVTCIGDEIKDKRAMKKALKAVAYSLLAEKTQKQMPWGMLTGIRPTKIVHDYHEQGYTDDRIEQELKEGYHISDAKVQLMMDVAKEEQKILDKNKPDEINIYIGIPFCPTRCVYCSFTAYSLEKKAAQVEPYLTALCKEISFIAQAKAGVPIRSLYIGGGTPTSLNEDQLVRLLAHIQSCFVLEDIEEYTLEAGRPDTITREKLQIMKDYGVGRISINPQTMNQKTLDAIGRHHTVEDIREVFHIARELGHTNINMDMILGLPGETPEDVAYTLDELEKLAPENITVHTMAIKKASLLKAREEEYELTQVQIIEEMLSLCERKSEKMGLRPYYMYRQKNMLGNFENVGYAKPGYECVYNIEIMEEKESIIAAGAGAITKMVYQKGERIDRVPNVKSLEDYIGRIDEMIERKRLGFEKYC
ncbi:MAG: coproporphyrinogen dehydrogenase HemZ [Cellulosilyticaceae bacterium]